MIGGLLCRITTFPAKDGAVRKTQGKTERQNKWMSRKQTVSVLSESCGSRYLLITSLIAIYGFQNTLAGLPWALRTGLQPFHKSTNKDILIREHPQERADIFNFGPLTK